jgi:hypothetical protein
VIYMTCGHIVGWVPPVPWYGTELAATLVRRRLDRPSALKLSVTCDGPSCVRAAEPVRNNP